MPETTPTKKPRLLAMIGPGLLVAATGVGAGDLATGALSGHRLGVAVLWAVVIGAAIKFVLNEGLARWQLATGTTVLEGTAKHIGRYAMWAFLVYLIAWSFFVGSALMSACGVAMHALIPVMPPDIGKIVFGIAHSALAVFLVRAGGFRLFEKVMSVCIAVMFVIVLVTAVAVKPDWGAVVSGIFVPRIPQMDGPGLQWTVALMGGVGGTVTVLCYGYWIREEGRTGEGEVRNCRIDLATGYITTALFGIGMVILGSRLDAGGGAKGVNLVVDLANQLEESLGGAGAIGRFAFLIGAWGAVASSMLGVWQSVPYLFADTTRLLKPNPEPASSVDPKASVYVTSLLSIATVPAVGLFVKFEQVQLAYAVVGATFMPVLAVGLLFLNGSPARIGTALKNAKLTTVVLVAILLFFVWAGFHQARGKIRNTYGESEPSRTSELAPRSR